MSAKAKKFTMFLFCLLAVLVILFIWGACSMASKTGPAPLSTRVKKGEVLVAVKDIPANKIFSAADYRAVYVDLSEPDALTPTALETYPGAYASKIYLARGTQITANYFRPAGQDEVSSNIFAGERMYLLPAFIEGDFSNGQDVNIISGAQKHRARFIKKAEGGAFIAAAPKVIQDIFLLEYAGRLISIVNYEEEVENDSLL